jgi:hypothetical protein
MSNASNVISLNITQFPQNLIIPNVANVVSIQTIQVKMKIISLLLREKI